MFPPVRFLSHVLLNYPAGTWAWYSRSRAHYNLWVSVTGTGTLQVNGASHSISPGFAVLLHPDDAVEGDKPPESRFCNIGLHFNPLLTETSAFDFADYCRRPIILRHLNVIHEIAKYMDDLIQSGRERHSAELNQLCQQMLCIFIRDHDESDVSPVDQLVRRQGQRMRNHPEQVWTVEQMAADAELSTSQFTRRFTELFRVPPNAFLIHQRMQRAQELLLESRLSVNEISETLGYRDVAFFSRQFKKHLGQPPSALRKRLWQLSGRHR